MADRTPDQPGDPDGHDGPGEDNPFKGTPFEQLFGQLGGQLGGQFGGAGGQLPDFSALMGQMQAFLQPYDGPVNWGLAHDIARRTTAQEPDPTPGRADRDRVADSVRLADHWLDAMTPLPSGVTIGAAWSRAEWVEQTMDVWKVLVGPVAHHVTGAVDNALGGQLGGLPEQLKGMEQMLGPLTGMFSQLGGSMFGQQVGSALGGLSQEVLSASDIGLPLGPAGMAALVTSNVTAFCEGLDVGEDDVVLYLALRECAHQRLFAHVPWLRQHLISSVEDYGRGMTIDVAGIESKLQGLDPTDPSGLQEALTGGLFEPEQTPAQKAALERLETTLALVEGWVDEVVGQATAPRMPAAAKLQEAVRRRRAAGGPAEQTFAALVGLELRPRRLRDASALWGSLRSRLGADERDAVWAHPDLLPSAADLDDPLGFKADVEEPAEMSDAEFDAELSKLLDGDQPDGPDGPDDKRE
ncbi:hydrolase [Nocardioides mangrovicus]|uniref:Hydrolase n=1 Tax=Nocardioides mangrovicus TaxID=2478913 RepID=A0A3L8P707_9ACTN|nr:zinc-dependent metalloprotease [Nocardioides mangrovicus]RLV50904.1 hydrolase [Nocardioides mangrovicus]